MASVIIMMGLIGSGKSTKAKELANNYETKFTIISQDELGSKKRCFTIYKKLLFENKNVIIDRCNINKAQRFFWIRLAQEWNYNIHLIWLDVNSAICYNRVLIRKDHPTIKENFEPERIKSIIKKFEGELEYPRLSEGFNSIRIIKQ